MKPFWRMKPTERFSDRAGEYARHRPGYPPEAMAAVLEGLGEPLHLVAADIGAGTGICSRLLAERGVRVLAIEPNRAMREAALPQARLEYRDGTAEHTGLPDHSVDLVLCAQAFHWFEPQAALAEFRRVLRPGGRLALLWNERDPNDAFTAGYSQLVREAAGEVTEARREGIGGLLAGGGFEHIRTLEFRYEQPLTVEGLIGRAASASYVPRSGPAYEALVQGLRTLHARFADASGLASLVYRTVVYLAS